MGEKDISDNRNAAEKRNGGVGYAGDGLCSADKMTEESVPTPNICSPMPAMPCGARKVITIRPKNRARRAPQSVG